MYQLVWDSSNLLLLEGRIQAGETWVREAHALINAAIEAGKAREVKDFDKLMQAGDATYNSCESCHAEYQHR